jgi:N6-L-threonylcarbamoyladenine synthase
MIVVGIETSCDETAIGILEFKQKRIKILANLIHSQVKIHQKYGGVYPFLAKREHKRNLPILFEKSLKILKDKKIDLIAVTKGPGLEPCLWEGINFAKEISKKLKIPVLGVNHLEAHILINFLGKRKIKNLLPALCLVISGGHTVLFLMEKIGKYSLLGQTRDDAVGECYDKIGRLFSFSYPAGPKIGEFLKNYKPKSKFEVKFPRPMINQKNYDFSFSGLKTAIFYDYKKQPDEIKKSKDYAYFVLKEMKNAVSDVLISKTFRAKKEFLVKSILVGGGVAADDFLQKRFKKEAKRQKIKIFFPEKKYCTDNGVMVSLNGYFNFVLKKKFEKEIFANPDLTI